MNNLRDFFPLAGGGPPAVDVHGNTLDPDASFREALQQRYPHANLVPVDNGEFGVTYTLGAVRRIDPLPINAAPRHPPESVQPDESDNEDVQPIHFLSVRRRKLLDPRHGQVLTNQPPTPMQHHIRSGVKEFHRSVEDEEYDDDEMPDHGADYSSFVTWYCWAGKDLVNRVCEASMGEAGGGEHGIVWMKEFYDECGNGMPPYIMATQLLSQLTAAVGPYHTARALARASAAQAVYNRAHVNIQIKHAVAHLRHRSGGSVLWDPHNIESVLPLFPDHNRAELYDWAAEQASFASARLRGYPPLWSRPLTGLTIRPHRVTQETALEELQTLLATQAGRPAKSTLEAIRSFVPNSAIDDVDIAIAMLRSYARTDSDMDHDGPIPTPLDELKLRLDQLDSWLEAESKDAQESIAVCRKRVAPQPEQPPEDSAMFREPRHAKPPPRRPNDFIGLASPRGVDGGRRGVPGVVYPPLPPTSGHKDPSHEPGEETCWVFDSGAGVAGFNNPYGLENIRPLPQPVAIGGIIDNQVITITQGGMLDGVRVLYSPQFTACCLPSSTIVDEGWEVRYHFPTDSYLVKTASGCKLCFQRHVMPNGRITTHYLCHPRMPYTGPVDASGTDNNILATSVQGNLTMHTPQDAKAAATAHRFLTNMGGNVAHAIKRLPLVKGIDITADHIRKAVAIFGPVKSHVQGTATSVQDVPIITELPSRRASPVPQSIAADLSKILGSWFVVGVFLPSHYTTVVHVPDHSAAAILTAMKTLVDSASRRNFDVLRIQADGELGIHSRAMDEYCASKRILLQRTGAGQHESQVERQIRSIKGDVRNMVSRIVPGALPRDLILHLVVAATINLNCRLTAGLDNEKYSPSQLWLGQTEQYAEDLDFTYGDLALAKTPNNRNDVAPRADTVMVLYPVFNGLHGYMVYKLGSKTTVVRNHNTLRHHPWSQADVDNIEQLGRDDPDGVELPRKEKGVDHGGHSKRLPHSRVSGGAPLETRSPIHIAPLHLESKLRSDAQEELALSSGEPVVRNESWTTEHPEVGTKIAKIFRGKVFFGTIDRALRSHIDSDGDQIDDLFHVTYQDGDDEELTATELQHGKDLMEQQGPLPHARGSGVYTTRSRNAVQRDDPFDRREAQPDTSIHAIHIHRISVAQAMKDQPTETDAAVRAELGQMLKLKVFQPISTENFSAERRRRIIRSSMFIKLKYTPSNVFIKCKARLVAGGDQQDKSLYSNISSPTATPSSVLFVSGDAAAKNKAVASMDIGAAYLNASMDSTGVEVDMIIEPKLARILAELDTTYAPFIRHDGSVCVRLRKALYGTVEAARLWYDLITKILSDHGFIPNPYDKCVMNKTLSNGNVLTVVLYVDDLFVTCESAEDIVQLKDFLMTKFPEVSFHTGKQIEYVGMTFDFETKPGAAVVTMKQITDDVIDTSGVKPNVRHASPAADSLFDIDLTSPILDTFDEAFYRTYVAKLLYLSKRVRPDILLTVAFLATRAHDCRKDDLMKLHRLISYVANTPDRGIVIEFGDNPQAKGYIDAAYGVHETDGKSHTGGSLIFGVGGPLYVTSVKQPIVAKSSTEAELVAFSDVTSELICLRNFSIGQGYPDLPAIVYQDNLSTMALIAHGGPCSKRSRHIDIRQFWVKERITEGTIVVQHCSTQLMWANLLTKALSGAQFITERTGLTNW
jgi:hypothetical protein